MAIIAHVVVGHYVLLMHQNARLNWENASRVELKEII